jgi:UDP-glucuronate 4-epimerase
VEQYGGTGRRLERREPFAEPGSAGRERKAARDVRYIVTGAAGFIGSHLAESLQAAGHEVVGIDSFTDYYDPALKERNARTLSVRRLDLSEDALDFAGFDGVFHLAGQPGVRSFGDVFPLYIRRNMLASQRVFEAAAAARVRVVFASSSSIYGDAERYPTSEEVVPRPVSPYGITKLACEHLARAYAGSFGLDAVVLRYFNAYGPRQRPDMAFPRVLDALASGGPFVLFGDGEQSRSFTFVADVVEASIVAMERAASGSTFNVGGGEEATMNDAIALLERIAGRPLDLRRSEAVAGDQRRTKADTTRILDELGWAPRTSLEQGLRAQWEWAVREAAEIESPA